MSVLLWILLAMQDAPAERPFRATLRVEQIGRSEDRIAVVTGALTVKPGEALIFVAGDRRRPTRTLIREGRAVEHRLGDKKAAAWNPSDVFHPMDLWRLPAVERRRLFHETEAPSAPALPETVSTAAGRPVAPVPMKLQAGARVVAAGEQGGSGCRAFVLVPREAAIRARVPSVLVWMDLETGRIARVAFETAVQTIVCTLSGVQELATVEDSVFELDLVNVNVEER